jgi:hypothetical protein
MLEQLKMAASHIREIEESRAQAAARVREEAQLPKSALEPEFILPLNTKRRMGGKVCAVDGGILSYEMHGADLLIAKAVASTFGYSGGELGSHSYFPNAFPQPEYRVETGLDERELLWHKSIVRLELEVKSAAGAAKKEKPAYLLLDGSLCPLPSDRPSEESRLFPKYLELLNLYKELYSYCSEAGVVLAGVIKDSRSRRFVEMLPPGSGERSSDTVFLNHMLREGERTFAFRYSDSPQKNHVLREMGKWGEKVCALYAKPVAGDRPVRVEFLDGQAGYSETADAISSLCAINRNYAYPSVLIDADLRAMMDPAELERAKKSLSLFAGPSLLDLKRNSRPFR